MIAVIGGTGLENLNGARIIDTHDYSNTPYGAASSTVKEVEFNNKRFYFLSRHREDHSIPPHKVNYHANIWALKDLGVDAIITVAAVGGITNCCVPGKVIIPDQIIDYTWGREHTFFDGPAVEHIDFSNPYDCELRNRIVNLDLDLVVDGTYGATQGPRLETAAEIKRMQQDGCDIVGMTGMPEASLARELGLDFVCCAISANWAAGISDQPITMQEIIDNVSIGVETVKTILSQAL